MTYPSVKQCGCLTLCNCSIINNMTKEETTIYKSAKKVFSNSVDVDYLIERLFEQTENEWFYSSNKEADMYSVCWDLADAYLIAKKVIPLYDNGSFHGTSTYFMYNKNLNYKNV